MSLPHREFPRSLRWPLLARNTNHLEWLSFGLKHLFEPWTSGGLALHPTDPALSGATALSADSTGWGWREELISATPWEMLPSTDGHRKKNNLWELPHPWASLQLVTAQAVVTHSPPLPCSQTLTNSNSLGVVFSYRYESLETEGQAPGFPTTAFLFASSRKTLPSKSPPIIPPAWLHSSRMASSLPCLRWFPFHFYLGAELLVVTLQAPHAVFVSQHPRSPRVQWSPWSWSPVGLFPPVPFHAAPRDTQQHRTQAEGISAAHVGTNTVLNTVLLLV